MVVTHTPGHRSLSVGKRIRDLWLGTRDRLLASPRFQRWAAGFPLTRPIADARGRALFDIVAGFVYSQVLHACVTLRIFPMLQSGPLELDDIAMRLQVPKDGVRCLLEAAVTLDLISRRGQDRYGLGSLGAAFIGNPGLAEMVSHHALFYADMADPIALLTGDHPPGRLQQFWAYARANDPAGLSAGEVDAYTRLMAASQTFVAEDILDAFPLRDARSLLDLGGGDGSFLLSAAARWPDLKLVLVDLPPVADMAAHRFAQSDCAERARAVGCDFHRDPLPTGSDVISLVRVLHDHDDDSVRMILSAAFAALPPGGRLIVAEPMAETAGAERVGAAYFNFYLRAMGSGRSRSSVDLQVLLANAGFDQIRTLRTRRPMMTGLIIGHRSRSM
jgi:demethylspheroidene O-methyltransferase